MALSELVIIMIKLIVMIFLRILNNHVHLKISQITVKTKDRPSFIFGAVS